MSVMRHPFPNPLQMGSLEAFCHPEEGHVFGVPRWVLPEGEKHALVVAAGFVVVRAYKGLWKAEEDFPRAEGEFLERVTKLPWDRFQSLQEDDWLPLADVTGEIFRKGKGVADCWVQIRGKWRVAPAEMAPLVSLADAQIVRLAHLQLVARLPRVAVQLRSSTGHDALFFRFNGGTGIIPHDPGLAGMSPALRLFSPRRAHYDGMVRSRTGDCPPAPNFGLPNWPPGDPGDP